MTEPDIQLQLTDTAFDPQAAFAAFQQKCAGAGAIVTFLGQVRSEGGQATQLSLECYRGFTEKEIDKIARSAASRWPLDAVRIVHRIGDMAPGNAIVFVAAAAAHRRDAFEAADFLMDYLKSQAPFWKQEIFNGAARWVEPTARDHADKLRWRAAE